MRYLKFKPAKSLTPFIECYFIWEGEAPEQIEVQSPPNCFGAIVFNYGDPTWASQNSSDLLTVPASFICGLFTSNFRRVMKGKIGMAGIVFKVTAIHNIFGIRMSTLVNSRMPLDLLIGADAEKLSESIHLESTDEARIKRFGTLSNRVAHATTIDWQDVVFENGLHDQSHLVKEFKEFNKMNPSEYHQNHNEMTRFVKS